MKSVFDPTFKYVRSTDTDIRKTFARVRAEMKKAAEKVTPLDDQRRQIREMSATLRGRKNHV